MAPLPPRQVYDRLTMSGASTNQAIGIIANAINESGLDPEAKGDNGTSFGIVQEHGAQYATLVSGNDQQDLDSQVILLAQQGGFAAASGPTPEQAAGNFAANYEKCVGCEVGGAQYMSRVGNVSTVAGWVQSGKWPKSAGSPSAGGTTVGGAVNTGNPGCLMANPFSTNLPLIGNVSAGPSCLFSTSQARALIGAGLLAAGGFVFLVGTLVIASYGLKGTAAGRSAAKGAEAAVAAVPVAGAPARAAVRGARRVRAGRREVRTLRASGASDLRTARQSPGTLRRAEGRGVRQGTFTPEGERAGRRRETPRQRAARMAGNTGGSNDRPPF